MPGGWVSWYFGPGRWVPWGKVGVAPTHMAGTGLLTSPGGETNILDKVPLAGNSESPQGKPKLSPAVKKRSQGRRQGCARVENPCFPQGKDLFLQCFLQFPSGARLERRCLVGADSSLLWFSVYACCFHSMEGPLSSPAGRRKMPNPGAARALTGPGLSPDMTSGHPSDTPRCGRQG